MYESFSRCLGLDHETMACTVYRAKFLQVHVDGLVQDCSIFSALAMEILQPCTKPQF